MVFILGLPTVLFFNEGVFDEYDYWAGTVSLVVFALFEVILFAWVFGMNKGWKEINEGGDIKVPIFYRFVIQYVTPLFLLFVFVGSLPELAKKISDFSNPYIVGARLLLLGIFLGVSALVYIAYQKRLREGRFSNTDRQ